MAGTTESGNFPTTPNTFQRNFGGGKADGFLVKLDLANSRLLYSTYLGGTGGEFPENIAVDRGNNVYVSGSVTSPDFPTAAAIQAAHGGGGLDSFLARFDQRSADRHQGKIVFSSKRNGHYEIYVMDANGSNIQRLTFSKKADRHPDW